jgi:hypothetical protein
MKGLIRFLSEVIRLDLRAGLQGFDFGHFVLHKIKTASRG